METRKRKNFSHLDPKTKANKFITKELFFDWSVNIHGILGLTKVAIIHEIPFIPGLFNQNMVECWFSLHRAQGGLNNTKNVFQWRNNQSSLLTHIETTTFSPKLSNQKEEVENFPILPLKRRKQHRKKENHSCRTNENLTYSEGICQNF
jgi:hypothetical protein